MARDQHPPSETNGSENEGLVTPGSQNATSTAPSQIVGTSIAASANDAEATKIVKSSPGV